jgi:hypothetical protein
MAILPRSPSLSTDSVLTDEFWLLIHLCRALPTCQGRSRLGTGRPGGQRARTAELREREICLRLGDGKDLSVYGFEDYTRIKHVMSYIGE